METSNRSVRDDVGWDICLVGGARPNFVKIAPLMRAIGRADASGRVRLRPHLVHTGQHYHKGLSDVFFRELGIHVARRPAGGQNDKACGILGACLRDGTENHG